MLVLALARVEDSERRTWRYLSLSCEMIVATSPSVCVESVFSFWGNAGVAPDADSLSPNPNRFVPCPSSSSVSEPTQAPLPQSS